MAFYFAAGTRNLNDLGGGQPGTKMVRQWDHLAPTPVMAPAHLHPPPPQAHKRSGLCHPSCRHDAHRKNTQQSRGGGDEKTMARARERGERVNREKKRVRKRDNGEGGRRRRPSKGEEVLVKEAARQREGENDGAVDATR